MRQTGCYSNLCRLEAGKISLQADDNPAAAQADTQMADASGSVLMQPTDWVNCSTASPPL